MKQKLICHSIALIGAGLFAIFSRTETALAATSEWDPMGLSDDISAFAISCDDAQICYYIASTNGNGVFFSPDGSSWEGYNTGLPNPLTIYDIVSEPPTLPSHYVFAATDQGVYRTSAYSGGNWWPATAGIGSVPVYAIAVDPSTPATVYAGGPTGAYKSTDSGTTWVPIGLQADNIVRSLAIDPQNPATLYAGTRYGLFTSLNGGGAWSWVGTMADNVHGLLVDPSTPTTLYAVFLEDAYKSTNSGSNWTNITHGTTKINCDKPITALAIDPFYSNVLFVGANGCHMFLTIDGGTSWTYLQDSIGLNYVRALGFHPYLPGHLYAGADMGLFSTAFLPLPFQRNNQSGIYSPTNPTLSWEESVYADHYEYCIDTVDNDLCDSTWIPLSTTSVTLNGLENKTLYHWQVRAVNNEGSVEANKGVWDFLNVRRQVFADVPIDDSMWEYIDTIYSSGITTGCGVNPLIFCPMRSVTRAAAAVFFLRAEHGGAYSPPPASHYFADLPVAGKEWQEAWVDQAYREGITGGCGVNPRRFCPENVLTRAAMAVFTLRAKYGSGYTPPPASHFYYDMPVPGKEWMEPWVDEIYREEIDSQCSSEGLLFCPEEPSTRYAIAAYIYRAFNLGSP